MRLPTRLKLAGTLNKDRIIVINLSGRGDKDLDIVNQALERSNEPIGICFQTKKNHKALIAYVTVG